MTILEKYNRYLSESSLSDEFREQLMHMSQDEINDCFYKELEFGTAGMRGLLGPGSNRLNIYVIRKATVGFSKYLLEKFGSKAKEQGVAISHDNRLFSREFAIETARTLSSYGIKSYLFDALRPTPELSYAVRRMKCVGGVMITASHNPKEYNGYKVYDKNGCQLLPNDIVGLVDIINNLGFELNVKRGRDPNPGQILIMDEYIDETYRQNVRKIQINKNLDKSNFTIIFTPQHGTAYENGLQLLKHLKYNVIPVKEQCSPDPYFSNTKSPNPENPEAYELALIYAKKYNADLVLCTDPDGDRIGIAYLDSHGNYQLSTGNETGALLINYIFSQREANGTLSKNGVLFNTIVTSDLGAKIARSYGVSVESLLTGFKYIGSRIHYYSKTKEKTFEFGYEESYGYLISPFVRDKDSLQAMVMIAEMTNFYRLQGKRLDEVMEEISKKYGYHADKQFSIFFPGQKGSETMKDIMNNLHEEPLKEIGGVKVVMVEDFLYLSRITDDNEEFIENLPSTDAVKYHLKNGTTIAIRPSGTEPKCKFYYDAFSKVSKLDAEVNIAKTHMDVLKILKIDELKDDE